MVIDPILFIAMIVDPRRPRGVRNDVAKSLVGQQVPFDGVLAGARNARQQRQPRLLHHGHRLGCRLIVSDELF